MKIIPLVERPGNLAYTLTWINIAGMVSMSHFDTEKEIIEQIIYLKN